MHFRRILSKMRRAGRSLSKGAPHSPVEEASLLNEPSVLDWAAEGASPFVGYCRWIPEHGDALVAKLKGAAADLSFQDLHLFAGAQEQSIRSRINRFAASDPLRFRRRILSLLQLRREAGLQGIVLTLDWPASMREIAFACRTLEIPTFLVPHESVFSDEQNYFKDPRRGIDTPVCDFVLCWGELQRRIFSDRGYPDDRLIKVGSPKLDYDVTYQKRLPSHVARRMLGFDAGARLALFAMQPMDNFGDKQYARDRQAAAISDALDYCEENNVGLVVRVPPSRDQIIPEELLDRIKASSYATLDEPGPYLMSPEEAIAQVDVVLSTNSTMLFEAMLMGIPAIATRYLDFKSIWDNVGIALATNRHELETQFNRAFHVGRLPMSDDAMAWAVENFSDGVHGFDGQACDRIVRFIRERIGARPQILQISVDRGKDTLCPSVICCSPGVLSLSRAHLANLSVRSVIRPGTLQEMSAADLFVKLEGEDAPIVEYGARVLGRPLHIVALTAGSLTSKHAGGAFKK